LPPAAFLLLLLLQSELVGKSEKDAYALPAANLVMLRLSRDELGFRPLAVAGELQVGGGGWINLEWFWGALPAYCRPLNFSGPTRKYLWLWCCICS
jgi:hypothetical protein